MSELVSREERDQALFDEIAASYARKDITPSSSFARRAQILHVVRPILAQLGDVGTVLEIGCGVGAPATYLTGHYQRYIGVDQSGAMIETARLFNRNQRNVEFIADNVKTAPLPDDTADVVLSVGALHHMTELDDVMQRLTRLAKPGALFLLIEPQNGNPLIQVLRRLRTQVDASYSSEQIYFSEQELRVLVERHGLRELDVTFYGYLSTPFAQVVLNPQALTLPLSRIAVRIDEWLYRNLRGPLCRLSFNIVVTGICDKQTR
jgi:SAM-dependent methyltransferase